MKVFLSYRRADSQATAGRMAQFLDAVPAVKGVFLDVDDIELGEDYENKIRRTLAEATHVFVLIGPQWSGAPGASGRARLFDDDDVVRLETRLALQSALRVVPVLIDDTRMPRPADLPDDLKAMSKLNAFVLRTAHFDEDMDDLLDAVLGGKKGRGSRWRLAPLTPAAIVARALGGVAVAGAVLLVAGVVNRYASDDCYDLTCTLKRSFDIATDADALGLLWMIAIALMALGAFAPFVPRLLARRR